MVKGWEAEADTGMGSCLRNAADGRCEEKRGILVWYLFCVHLGNLGTATSPASDVAFYCSCSQRDL